MSLWSAEKEEEVRSAISDRVASTSDTDYILASFAKHIGSGGCVQDVIDDLKSMVIDQVDEVVKAVWDFLTSKDEEAEESAEEAFTESSTNKRSIEGESGDENERKYSKVKTGQDEFGMISTAGNDPKGLETSVEDGNLANASPVDVDDGHQENRGQMNDFSLISVAQSRIESLRRNNFLKTSKERNLNFAAKQDAISEVKCRFFPFCTAESCLFYHPKEECKNFPHCPLGSTCRYIHPKCKYAFNCTRMNCAYAHPPGMTPGFFPQIVQPMPQQCKFGYACTNTKCHFAHPSLACRYGAQCKFQQTCKYSHLKSCKFGDQCRIVGCTFSHPPKGSLYNDDGGSSPLQKNSYNEQNPELAENNL